MPAASWIASAACCQNNHHFNVSTPSVARAFVEMSRMRSIQTPNCRK